MLNNVICICGLCLFGLLQFAVEFILSRPLCVLEADKLGV